VSCDAVGRAADVKDMCLWSVRVVSWSVSCVHDMAVDAVCWSVLRAFPPVVRTAVSGVRVCPAVRDAAYRTDRRLDPPLMSSQRNNAFRASSIGWLAGAGPHTIPPPMKPFGRGLVSRHTVGSPVPDGGPDYVRLTIHSSERVDQRRAKHVIEQWSRTKLAIIYWCVESASKT
jgi:hypothetical protein